jgi:hypothetical protein
MNAVSADYFLEDNREELMKARELGGRIDAVDRRREKLLAMLDDDPMPEIATALKKANAERAVLVEQKSVFDQAAVLRANLSRSREVLLAKIDLTGNTARMDANNLLRRLGIFVEIGRYDTQVRYTAKQNGKRMLMVYQQGDKVQAMAYSEDTAMRIYERGETDEPEMNISLSHLIGRSEKRPERVEPDLPETPCTQEPWDWSEITLEPYGYTSDSDIS